MYVSFEQLTPEAKIWIYQADKPFTEPQTNWLTDKLTTFTQNWESHGHPLQGSFAIKENQFIIIGIEGSFYEASGCSIDKSFTVIKDLEQELNINLLDRSKLLIKKSTDTEIIPLNQIKSKVQDNILASHTLVYNNTITTKKELQTNWIIPAKDTWLSKYFNN